MKRMQAFFDGIDPRAWRMIWLSLVLFGVIAVFLVLGKTGIVDVSDQLEHWLEHLRNSPWGLPATILVFILTSFIAAPQFVLAGACVVAFGPWMGAAYAMAGTAASSWLHFYLGRWGGAGLVKRYGGETLNRLSRFIGRNDFLASTVVRNLPTAPAIVVNMAFGASHANFWRFMAGVVLGSIPKIAIMALLGQSFLAAQGGGLFLAAGAVVGVIGIWLTVKMAARKAAGSADADPSATPAAGADVSG